MNLTETRKKVVNDGISNFEHRQTAAAADDDDEGMDLHKKNRCCREPPAWEGLLVHITDFFCAQVLIITLQGSAILSLQQQYY